MISEHDQQRISNAIHEAEKSTAGEIFVVVARQASAYRAIPALVALFMALVSPWPLIWFTDLGPTRIFTIQLAVAAALNGLLAWPPLHLALIPNSIKRARAHEAALREFVSHGLSRTQGRTGVLIYVAAAEHYAEIIADIGIADRAGPALWQEIIDALTAAIRQGKPCEGLLQAVQRAGAILAEHAPPQAQDANELPNKVVLL
ncbi:TPM domain-containing protein [Microvirga guangxiensis]|uniref:Putative membrane protein n=1 Tax=Microvirga guangxiensis TaxID=549386 RepID=A0A1G5DUZ7_9HYPH|nr:TPM domain-containing protein [Microvirga guangxiensis]SCY18562.1 putative membrane protein [Microvirga guangxiensis]